MTKYEWESELRKNIHRLPNEEIQRVLEYYGELFADKAERGLSETEIVSQFGNPIDVADKILSEYEGELKPAEHIEVPPAATKTPQESVSGKDEEIKEESAKPARSAVTQKSGDSGFKADRFILFMLLNFFTGFTLFILIGTVWIVTLSLTVAGGAMAIGGIAGTFISLVQICMGSGLAGLAQTGACVALCGVGILLVGGLVFAIRLLAKGTVKLFKILREWICPSKSEINGQTGVEI